MVAEIEGRLCVWRQSAKKLIILIEYNFIFVQITFFQSSL